MNESEKNTTTLRLISSHDEAGNVRTFVFETGGLEWLAGQYQSYVLPQASNDPEENEHPFTISSAPSEGTVNISTRVSESLFKQALNSLEPGGAIEAGGPKGDFTWEEEGEPVVLVAGGIGVTPFRSILLERKAKGKPLNATLLHFNRTDEIPFENELKALAEEFSEFTIASIVGERITAERILELAPQSSEQTLYISGAEPMVEAIGSDLNERGVTVKQDWFPGYDEKNY